MINGRRRSCEESGGKQWRGIPAAADPTSLAPEVLSNSPAAPGLGKASADAHAEAGRARRSSPGSRTPQRGRRPGASPPRPGADSEPAGSPEGAGAGGRRGAGRGRSPALKVSRSCRFLGASCGGGRRAPPPGRPLPAQGGGQAPGGPGDDGDSRAEGGRAPRPGVPRSRVPPGRRKRALLPARRGRDGGTRAPAGQGRAARRFPPGWGAGRGRLHPGSPRLSRARPGRPLLTQGAGEEREQCREREAAAATGRQPHPGDRDGAPCLGAGTGDARERSCAAAAPAAAADPPPPAPLLPPALRRAGPRRALWRPKAGAALCARPAPARLVARGSRLGPGPATG